MGDYVVVGYLQPANKQARQKILEKLMPISEYARTQEPEVSKYAITIPVDESEVTIYVIEEYTGKPAFDSHMASEPVANILKLFGTEGASLLSGPGAILYFEADFAFSRPELVRAASPAIAFGTLEYKDGAITGALEGWRQLGEQSEKNELNTLSYNVWKNKDKKDQLRTLGVYKSKEHFEEHEQSAPAMAHKERQAESVASSGLVWLQLVGGFLGRDKASSSNL